MIEEEPFPPLHQEPVFIGVNSFGLGGGYGHAILTEYKPSGVRDDDDDDDDDDGGGGDDDDDDDDDDGDDDDDDDDDDYGDGHAILTEYKPSGVRTHSVPATIEEEESGGH
jgi:hypothetical protein